MLVPRRHQSLESYKYGFQGQEKDDEIKGEGNSLNYTFRMHDPRVGRFFARDPLSHKYPWNSPYAFSENVVISEIELEGLEQNWVIDGGKVKPASSEQYHNKSLKKYTSKTIALKALQSVKMIINFEKLIISAKSNTRDYHERQKKLMDFERILENPKLKSDEINLANALFPEENQNLGVELIAGIGGFNLSNGLVDFSMFEMNFSNENIKTDDNNIIFCIKF